MRVLPLLLALSCLVAGCGDSPTEPSEFPMSVTMQVGEQTNAGGLVIVFQQVVNDSRCPINVTCVSAGEATIQLNLSTGGSGTAFQLTLLAPATNHVVYQDYTVQLATLEPRPQTGLTIAPSAYRATLTIDKN